MLILPMKLADDNNSLFVFNVPPTAKAISGRGHCLKSHPTYWRKFNDWDVKNQHYRQICSIKPEDVATVRSSELLAKLELEDLYLM